MISLVLNLSDGMVDITSLKLVGKMPWRFKSFFRYISIEWDFYIFFIIYSILLNSLFEGGDKFKYKL